MTHPYESDQLSDPRSDIVVIEEADDETPGTAATDTAATDTEATDTEGTDTEATDTTGLNGSDLRTTDFEAGDLEAGDLDAGDLDAGDESDEPAPTADSYAPSHAAGNSEASPGVSREWQDIQALFVDDPRGAVELAAAAADGAVSAFMTALREQQAALTPAAAASADATAADPGQTEQLRAALRGYRSLCQNLAQVGTSLRYPASTVAGSNGSGQ